jgi:toxin ParE1/3/4
MKKEWSVHLGDQAEADLRGIYEYISAILIEPEIAKNLIWRIETKISKLNISPQSYAVYPGEPWKSCGLRRVNSGKYAIFFIPNEKEYVVTVIRIVYGGRDIGQILDDTPSI